LECRHYPWEALQIWVNIFKRKFQIQLQCVSTLGPRLSNNINCMILKRQCLLIQKVVTFQIRKLDMAEIFYTI